MGLVACPDCANQVSTMAPSCPKCGRPMGSLPIPAASAPPPPPAVPENEASLWTGGPSQLTGFKTYIACGLGVAASIALAFLFPPLGLLGVVPLLIALWTWLEISNTRYELTTERLRFTRGVLSRKTDEMELYRVKDLQMLQPLLYRIFGLASLELESSDKTTPKVLIPAIAGAVELRETIRKCVELCRQRRGVREMDVQ